jgi:thioredoxin 1
MASANTHTANDTTFDAEVLQSPVPVLVDFWAEWCGPCRMIGPMLDQIADETTGQAKVVKVNVDECRDLALRYQVRSIRCCCFSRAARWRIRLWVPARPRTL